STERSIDGADRAAGVWGTDGNLRRGKSELAGATLERVLTAGVYDRRWHALVPYLRRLSRAGSMCGALSTSTVGAYVRLVPKRTYAHRGVENPAVQQHEAWLFLSFGKHGS